MISVIVPAYNIESYLPECLESILGQTYGDLQIIAVDDGSTDGTGQICDEYARKDGRVQAIHTENRGLVAARKEGLRHARGQYVGFVDGDDSIHPRMYEEMLKEMEASDADFVHFGYMEECGGLMKPHLKFEEGVYELGGNPEGFLKRFVLREAYTEYEAMTYSVWSKLFKKELICRAYGKVPDYLAVGEDLAALCICVMEAERVVLMRKALYKYRVLPGSLSRRGSGAAKAAERALIYYFLRDVFVGYHCLEAMEKALNIFLTLHIYGGLQEDAFPGTGIPFFRIAGIESLFGKRIVLYGAGRVGRDYYMEIRKYMQCSLVAWADKNYKDSAIDYAKLAAPEDIAGMDCEIVLIAVEREGMSEEIRRELEGMGIPPGKIRWIPPSCVYSWKEGRGNAY